MTKVPLALAALLAASAFTSSAQAQAEGATTYGPRLSRAELLAKYPQPAGRTISVNGVEVYYMDEGHDRQF